MEWLGSATTILGVYQGSCPDVRGLEVGSERINHKGVFWVKNQGCDVHLLGRQSQKKLPGL